MEKFDGKFTNVNQNSKNGFVLPHSLYILLGVPGRVTKTKGENAATKVKNSL